MIGGGEESSGEKNESCLMTAAFKDLTLKAARHLVVNLILRIVARGWHAEGIEHRLHVPRGCKTKARKTEAHRTKAH